jgi:DNA-directed RNA polymerase subunit M/transcription elongation factor TFIIS
MSSSDEQDLGIGQDVKIDIQTSQLFKPEDMKKYRKGTRMRKLKLFYSTLMKVDLDLTRKTKIARQIERGCYNSVKDICTNDNRKSSWSSDVFVGLYDMKCMEIFSAMDPSEGNTAYSPELVRSLISGEIDPETLAKKTALELNVARQEESKHIIMKSKGTQKVEFTSSSHNQCFVCGSSETRTIGRQTRSLDEGTSKKVICLKCGNKWDEC